jgi:hypothetical protein
MVSLLTAMPGMAQQEVTIRELNTYTSTITSQADLSAHPLNGVSVIYDAVVVAYPRNSGLATPNKGASGAEPGRIHLFVTDVNAIDDGREGMSMQLVVSGAEQRTLETLQRGDVITVTGNLSFFGNESQFSATDVTYLGGVEDPAYSNLAPLLDPIELDLTDVNQNVPGTNTNKWVASAYSKYIHTYVKFKGVEIIDRLEGTKGSRPWFVMSDGNTSLMTSDISLRYRNDRETYGFKVTEDGGVKDTVLSLNYNYRRKDAGLDGRFNPPPTGSVVDVSGYLVLDDFDPTGVDANDTERTFRIVPWEDGIRWTADGTDTSNRITTGIPNDLEVKGFAPTLDQFTVTPDSGVTSTDQVAVSIDVLKPENDYTIDSVMIAFSDYPYTADSGDTTTAAMTGSGDTYSYTFNTFPEYITVDYTITAYAKTADGVGTKARQSGSFQVISATETAPVSFTPTANETYINLVSVELSTVTPNSTIYYTDDGSTPDESSTEYTAPINLTESATIKAVAKGSGLTLSAVNERSYSVTKQINEVSTLASIRDGVEGDVYKYTGNAVVTYARPSSGRNQIFLMDASGGLLIDDSPNVITSAYAIGDVMTGVQGELSLYNGLSQFLPALDPGAPTATAAVTPVTVPLADITASAHQSMLIKVEGVTFADAGGTFEGGKNYDISDGSGNTMNFRTNFSEADYIGETIPTGKVNITALVGVYNSPQLTARSKDDFEDATSNELDGIPDKFALQQNYPNPFNPTTVIRYSVADVSGVQLQVYDILGRKVATLVNEVKTPGSYTVNFNASALGSGTYFYRIEAGDFTAIKKMMLIK